MNSNAVNLKGMLFTEDMRTQQCVPQDKCISLDKYEYSLNKSRMDNGQPYPSVTSGSILSVTLKIGSRDSMKVFYERVSEFSPATYSVIFDGQFGLQSNLEAYYSAFVLTGYIVGLDEEMRTGNSEEGSEEYITLQVQILINSIAVLGNGKCITYA